MKIGVVGGGILGGWMALRLADNGQEVTLLERADLLGGLASAWTIGDVIWDKHYHVTLAGDSYTLGLIDRLGLEDEMTWVQTRTGTWVNDKRYSVSTTLDYVRYPVLSVADKARLGYTILSAARIDDWQPLEHESVEEWLRKKSGDRVFEAFWLPLLKSKLGDAYADTSAAFIWMTIKRLYSARSSGNKNEQFGYVHGGYFRTLNRLADELKAGGVDIQTGVEVTAVEAGPTVRMNQSTLTFDRVIVTTPPPVAMNLVSDLTQVEKSRLASLQYQGIVCASLLTSQPLDGYYLTYLYEEAPFTGVVEMSAFVDRAQFGGRTLIYLPRYTSPSDPIFEESDESIRDRFLDGLKTVYPYFDRDLVEAFQVSRVRHVFPISTLGYSDRVLPFQSSVHGVYLVNSSQIINGTLNVNDTISLAERALEQVFT